MNKSSFKLNSGTYRTVGDYKIPNITLLPKQELHSVYGGLKRKDFL